jgi:hypothetical protein
MKDIFIECSRAFNKAAQQYAARRCRATGEDRATVTQEVARAMVGVGCTLLCAVHELGPDRAIAETEKCFASISETGR